MARNSETHSRLAPVLAMFPARKHELRRLSLKDPHFRSLSDDLCAAHDSLSRLLARPEMAERPEVAEYRVLIGELEAELRQYLATHGEA
jgi:uncharacterized protein YdcH (DUF465 family)